MLHTDSYYVWYVCDDVDDEGTLVKGGNLRKALVVLLLLVSY